MRRSLACMPLNLAIVVLMSSLSVLNADQPAAELLTQDQPKQGQTSVAPTVVWPGASQALASTAPGEGKLIRNRKIQQSRQRVIDCRRGKDHCVSGKLVDSQGRPVSGATLTLANSAGHKVHAKTDRNGGFQFRQAATGIYAMQAGANRGQMVRVWDDSIAPPQAKSKILAVVEGKVIRAQCCANPSGVGCAGCGGCDGCCGGGCGTGARFGVGRLLQGALDNPWMVAAGTAAAIAIPLAVDDDDERAGDAPNEDVVADETASGEDAS